MRMLMTTAAALLTIAPAVAQAPTLKTGRWQHTTLIAGEAKPMVATECEDERDLTDLDRLGLSDNPSCVWQRRRVAGGLIDVAGTCPTSAGRVTSSVKGSYTATTMTLTIATVIGGRAVTMRSNGKWIGQCSADD